MKELPLRLRCSSAMFAALLLFAAAGPVSAYTLLRNNYPNDPVGCDNAKPAYPCITWPKTASGYSSTTYIYLDSSLTGITAVNMKQDTRDAFGRWNGAPA